MDEVRTVLEIIDFIELKLMPFARRRATDEWGTDVIVDEPEIALRIPAQSSRASIQIVLKSYPVADRGVAGSVMTEECVPLSLKEQIAHSRDEQVLGIGGSASNCMMPQKFLGWSVIWLSNV